MTAVVPLDDTIIDGHHLVDHPMEPDFATPYANEILHFASCVRDGTEPISSGRDNIETMKVIYGCYRSAKLDREVMLSEL